ncbi:cytochrome c oxidase subunit II [Leptolyngbyaceae cyanobacterium CCMR0082]|uniref:Cytochrome c oxidase subunit 2 n=3 Tax=Adonisia TaxID=2950183 RepID=A0A6M0SG03_9CYAN|nr:cytochrome c oxidase subunit II [Leptothoe sp. LEGE 181152]NEZ54515.1 cytochrome c oxidase subunit II [Adonisia turfae CCMR0081]NEZ66893.1 cytochrome c oxidase subunit II [Adonisia turfae CCMR0082]
MNGIPTSIVTMLIGVAVTLISLWYGQNHGLMPVAASTEASEVDQLFNLMMTIGTGLFLIVEGALVISLIRFRRKKGDETDGPHIEGNIPLEILWTAIPAIIVLGLSVYSFEIYTEMGGLNLMEHHSSKAVQLAYASSNEDTSSYPMVAASGLGKPPAPGELAEDTLNIDVLGLQFAFVMTYPDTGIVDGEVHVPVGKLVKLNLKAQDVIHAFWLPEFRIKQDMIPGKKTTLVFKATREGTYPVVCAELCGSYHGGMRTQMIVHSPEEYDEWVQKRIASGSIDLSTAIAAASQKPAETDTEYLAHFKDSLHMPAEPMPHSHMDMALMP